MRMNRPFSVALIFIFVFSLVFVPGERAQALSTDVVIAQVYGGGGNSGATYNYDYVVLYNKGAAAVSLAGWSIQYASATGTGNFGAFADGITPLSGSIGAGQYILVREATNNVAVGAALPAADITDATPIAMSGTNGKVALATTAVSLGCNGGSTPCNAAVLALIKDLVGYGNANFYEGAGAAPVLSNTLADFRGSQGCTETDNNNADFAAALPAPLNSASPLHTCSSSTPPSGTGAASPSTLLAGGSSLLTVVVTPGASPVSTGLAVTCNLSLIGGSTTQGFYDDATNGDVTAANNTFSYSVTVPVSTTTGTKSLPCAISDAQGRGASANISITVRPAISHIHTIQGAGHLSPVTGSWVSIEGILTAKRPTGIYVQEEDADADTDIATSEGMFVYTGTATVTAVVGDKVQVYGKVTEYRQSGYTKGLTLTELGSASISIVSSGNSLPAPIVIGTGGRIPPGTIIEDDATNVETNGTFDPIMDGIDFYECLENMYVRLNNAVVVGPYLNYTTNHEVPVVGDNGAHAGLFTARGGLVIGDDYTDFNPERIILNDWISGGAVLTPVDVGDAYPGVILGVMDYAFSMFKLQVISVPSTTYGGLTQELTAAQNGLELSVATFNVENLAPSDSSTKYTALANLIITNLQAPDILAIEEIQDNSGATNNGVVAADVTWGTLISAIQTAGGPTYSYRQIDPVDVSDGGAPGGNIRVGFLFRTDRGVAFVDRPGAGATTANAVGAAPTGGVQLLYSPGRINPTSSAFDDSRKPLAGEFTFRGQTIIVIANHFASKGGDDPLFGFTQDPVLYSETQRLAQAQEVTAFVQQIYAIDPAARVVVAGDLNDYQFSNPVNTLEAAPLFTMIETLTGIERYTYVYQGNSQALDHILLSPGLFSLPHTYDVVHVNSEFAAQVSDHEPQVVHIQMDDVPVVLFGALTSPSNGAVLTAGINTIYVQYNKAVIADGGADAANNPINYLLVEEGPTTGFQTLSCAGGFQLGDTRISVQTAVYSDRQGPGPFVATLSINNGVLLPDGSYRLYVCGTTSIMDLFGNTLNGGMDTAITFRIGGALPATGFAPGGLTVLPQQPADLAYSSSDLNLEIPSLGVNVNILGVPNVNGNWDVTWLGQNAGWLDGSAFPTWSGNSVLTAHVWNADNTPGTFNRIGSLKYGDRIIIHAFGQDTTYEVRSIQRILPDASSTVFQHEDSSWLSLLTCSSFNENSGLYRFRTLVRAVQVGIK